MDSKNMSKQLLARLVADFRKYWNDESGYYYVEFKEDKQGKKQVKIESGIVYALIACITILFLTILVLAYQSKVFPVAVVFLITVSFLAFLTVMVLAVRSKWGIALQITLSVMLALCLGILGFHIKDIIDVFRALPIK
jgi:hypothetical protein